MRWWAQRNVAGIARRVYDTAAGKHRIGWGKERQHKTLRCCSPGVPTMATATTRAATTSLPLELGDISDERREQLELRRRREMARQQESRSGTGNFRWSPIAMIPAHLCVLVFLVFLLEKLEGGIGWPWAAVLSPLWITDAVFIVIKVRSCRIQ